jgi:hypothetical protein
MIIYYHRSHHVGGCLKARDILFTAPIPLTTLNNFAIPLITYLVIRAATEVSYCEEQHSDILGEKHTRNKAQPGIFTGGRYQYLRREQCDS